MTTARLPIQSVFDNSLQCSDENWLAHIVHAPTYHGTDELETFLVLEGVDKSSGYSVMMKYGNLISPTKGDQVITEPFFIKHLEKPEYYRLSFLITNNQAKQLTAGITADQDTCEKNKNSANDKDKEMQLIFKVFSKNANQDTKKLSFDWVKKMILQILPDAGESIKDIVAYKKQARHVVRQKCVLI